MPGTWQTIRTVRGAVPLAVYTFLFFLGMWLSKTVQPLYFAQHGHLVEFGLSYTAMAIAGAASVVIGRLADRWGTTATFRGGAVLYALGMALRVVHDQPVVAVLSGVVAGFGASAVFIALRSWTLLNVDEPHRPGVVGLRELVNQTATALGTGSAGLLAAFLGGGDTGYRVVLLAAAGCVLLGVVVTPPGKHVKPSHVDGARGGLRDVFSRRRSLAVVVVATGLLSGVYLSLLTPYLPLVLRGHGVPLGLVGFVVAAASLARIATAALAGRFLRGRPPLRVFAVSEGACAVTTAVLGLATNVWVAVVAVVLRGVFLCGAIVAEELAQLQLFPAATAGVFFGLVQSSFLAGDALGGAAGGLLYQAAGSGNAVLVATAGTVANAIVFPLCYRWVRRHAPADVVEPAHAVA